mgnify:CR=1 FL=1
MRKIMKREYGDVSVISDIVKRKKITFLKSSNLFAQDEDLFCKSNKKREQDT